jgi:hypothetical protein
MQWDTIGNAWNVPETGVSQVPASPDVFTNQDAEQLGFIDGPFDGEILSPAVLQWGWWANYAAWHMVRAYNLRWKIGQHTNIMDEVLRHTAYMPPNAQEGSSSDSEVDVVDFVNQMNQRYVQLGSALIFLKTNFRRVGSTGAAGSTAWPSSFEPTRDFVRVGATFGGMDLRSMLRGNSEFRKLTLPYLIKPGVPIGLILQENDTVQANQMRRAMDITNGQGGVIPPNETDFTNINLNAIAQADELTLQGAIATNQIFVNNNIFKGGDFKLTLAIRGFEVTEDWYNTMSNSADIRDVVMSACGIRFALQGAA